MTWNYPKATRYLESERGENKLKDTIFHLVNAASHMWAHTDIKYELLTFMPYVHKAVSRWITAVHIRSTLILFNKNQPFPYPNVSMETSVMRVLVLEAAPSGDPWWNQSQRGHPSPLLRPLPVPDHDSYSGSLAWRGSPKLYRDHILSFKISLMCTESIFPSAWVKPCLTFLPVLTFS